MSKKIMVAFLILAFCFSSFAFATPVDNEAKEDKVTQETVVEETVAADEDAAIDETIDEEEAVDTEEPAEAVENDEEEAVENDAEEAIENEEEAADPDETAEETAVGKGKIAKEKLKEKIQERLEVRIEAKIYIKEIKKLFKDADPATKKDILREIAKMKRELKDYSIGVFLKGLVVDFEKYDNVTPVIKEGRTLVPVRAIIEAYGASVAWNDETSTITITKGDTTIVMQIDSKTATVNGEQVTLDVAPTIEKGRTLVPIRFISEQLKLKVDFDEESQTVVIEE